jgi:hypothetical protein
MHNIPTAAPHPPQPRSQQLRNAAAAATGSATPPAVVPMSRSMLQSTMHHTPVHTPMSQRRTAIDYGKYKTKLCRNYQLGYPCPFEDRCVFAHGEDQISQEPPMMYERHPRSTTSAYSPAMEFPAEMSAPDYTPASVSDDDFAPPSYETFLATAVHHDEPASPMDSEPCTPVSSVRFRHDPYRPEGFVYQYQF